VTQPGTRTEALATHVDLTRTVAALGGIAAAPSLPGVDLTSILADPSLTGRDSVLFAQDSAWYERCIPLRYAIRGMFDGRYKYARYYGVGGSTTQYGQPWRKPKLFDVDAAFEDQDHEFYDLHEDPHELVNLANDRGRRGEVREWFERLRGEEAENFGALA
jgi:arylsulfatase A-like enzyme